MPYFSTDLARRDEVRGPHPLVLTRRVGASVVVEHHDARTERLGLHPGMSLAQAQAIAPELLALPHEPRRDREALRRLASWAVRFSPLVEPIEPDKLLIDITGCQRLFGGEANIARQAIEGLRRQGFSARGAIADTVGAAYALAFAGVPAGKQHHVGAEFIIAPTELVRDYLAPLPPTALRIDPRVSTRLESLGVRTIGDLLKLPRASLPARFGPQLVSRLRQALGEVFEGVAVHKPERTPHARFEFEQPVRDLATVQPIAKRLLTDVIEQLRRLDLALRRFDCVLYYEGVPPMTLSIGLSRPSRSARHTAELLRQRLEQADLSTGVCGLMLVARETARWRAGQVELFEPHEPDDEEELGCLIDRLAARLGYQAVLRSQLLDDYQPEMAFRYVSVAGECPTPSRDRIRFPLLKRVGHPGARPVQLFPRPIPIRVIALVPDGPPSWFAYCGKEYVIAAAEGPERLETAWWRGPDIRRDYFRTTAETGEQFWIFHALHNRQWYLHGLFA